MGEDQSGTKKKRETHCIVCTAVVNEDRPYYKRYRTCRSCASREMVMLRGSPHRFCQQCGKYEPLECFDVGTRTCRVALARHAERRRMASEKRRQQSKQKRGHEENGRPLKKQANVFYPKVLRVGSADPVEAVLAEEKRTAIFESAASACVKQKTIQYISNGSTIPPSQVLATLHSIIRSFFFATENGSGDARSHVGEVNNGKPSSESTESTESVGQRARRPVGAPRYILNDMDMQYVIEILKWCLAASDQSKHPNAHS